MKGVMMPAVSAGSNQVGARETGEPMRSSPSAAAPAARAARPIMAAAERPRAPRRVVRREGEAMAMSPLSAALQAEVFVGRGIGMAGDQVEGGLVYPWSLAVEEAELEQRRVHRALVHDLLHAVQQLDALGLVGRLGLLGEQLVDIGIAAIDIGAALDDEGLHPGRGVAEGAAAALDQVAVFLLAILLGEGGALHRPQFDPDADLLEAVDRRLAEVGIGGVAEVLAAVEAIAESRLRQQLARRSRVVRDLRRLPVALVVLRHDAAGDQRMGERQRLV